MYLYNQHSIKIFSSETIIILVSGAFHDCLILRCNSDRFFT